MDRTRAFQTFLHGAVIVTALAVVQLVLTHYENSFMLYYPPLGFAFLIIVMYIVQPLIVGALDAAILTRILNLGGCQTGFWISGFFLVLIFGSINLVLQTTLGWSFTALLALLEVLLFAYPFGWIGRFTRISSKATCQQ